MSGIKDTLLGDTPFAGFSRPHFDGATYDHQRDYERLNAQCRRVAEVMADGLPHTLSGLAARTQALYGKRDPEASISARLRDLRKAGFIIEREYVKDGQHQYTMVRAI